MSLPSPSPSIPPARIIVTYENDVAGGAETLLAILRHLPRCDEPPRGADLDDADTA